MMRSSLTRATTGLALTALLSACSSDDRGGSADVPAATPDKPAKPAKLLSEYGLFADPGEQIPAEGVLAYDLVTPHFADYARVRRFLKLPPGESATYDELETFDLPVGTILAQTLSFPYDLRDPEGGELLVETRLLIHRPDGWIPVPYLWNDEATEARKSVAGALVPVAWTHIDGVRRELRYLVPNSNDCKRCHERSGRTVPVGLQAWNLNHEVSTLSGTANQLAEWRDRGLLAGLPDDASSWPHQARWDDPQSGSVEKRARAWLAANCSHCHNPKGPGAVSGLDLSRLQDNPIRYGIFKPPVAAGRGSDGLRYSVAPGEPDESFMIRRLMSDDPAIMMPPVGRRTQHEEGVALIREWIAEMRFDDADAEALKTAQKEAFQRLVESGQWTEPPSD
jgi:uncharacterized repeat protein (TIGR03806 family)